MNVLKPTQNRRLVSAKQQEVFEIFSKKYVFLKSVPITARQILGGTTQGAGKRDVCVCLIH